MTARDDLRWAARYDFVEELWRDRARVIFDRDIEAALLAGVGEAERALLDALVPPGGADGVWVVVGTSEVAARLRRQRPGVTFLPREGLGDLLRRADWDVALVELDALAAEDEATSTDGFRTRVEPARGAEPEERRGSMLAALGRGVEQGRAVVLAVPAATDDEREGLDYGELADILAQDLGGGRIYGLYQPSMAAIVDFGERIEASGEPLEAESVAWVDDTGSIELPVAEAMEPDDDVPLVYDNTLGSQEPDFSDFIAVAGSELAESGLTLIELPAAPPTRPDDEIIASLRAQLQQARRRADLAAIDRQSHLERVDALEAENERLRAEAAELRDRLARVVDGSSADVRGPAVAADQRLDAALAREQALRWRVTQLERELEALVGRPVDALQAEVASLRAQLEQASAREAEPEAEDRAIDTVEPSDRVRRPVNGHRTEIVAHPLGVASATRAAVRAVEDLVKRVERGGISTLELRRNLVALRRRLQR